MPREYDERYQVRDEEAEHNLRKIGQLVSEVTPEGWGFGLFLIKFGNRPLKEGGAVFWISNSEREGMIEAIKGFIEDSEKRKVKRNV